LFPTTGAKQRLSGELTLPGSDLTFYKINYRHSQYFSLIEEDLTLGMRVDLGYGDGYDSTRTLPFYENFFTGGPKSIRGFEDNTLGPRGTCATPAPSHASSDCNGGDPIGGNVRTVGSVALYFSPPFETETKNLRFSTFVDAGNVFGDIDSVDTGDMRVSAGVSMVWISPVGPLALSYAEPIVSEGDDEVQEFQFTLGSAF
jgi:outer membrane protein insertion porin family